MLLLLTDSSMTTPSSLWADQRSSICLSFAHCESRAVECSVSSVVLLKSYAVNFPDVAEIHRSSEYPICTQTALPSNTPRALSPSLLSCIFLLFTLSLSLSRSLSISLCVSLFVSLALSLALSLSLSHTHTQSVSQSLSHTYCLSLSFSLTHTLIDSLPSCVCVCGPGLRCLGSCLCCRCVSQMIRCAACWL